jgi:hypothetical protein
VLRVAVNVGASLGSAGIETSLAPSMTVGTGFFGRSSVGENLEPSHLVQWTRLAYNADPAEPFGKFTGIIPWQSPAGHGGHGGHTSPVPPYPRASNLAGYPTAAAGAPQSEVPQLQGLRDEIRRLVIEELNQMAGG